MAESPSEPPFIRIGPEEPLSPVVLSVPHAGRAYSQALLRASRLPVHKLETLEDRLVDRLVWRAVQAGASALVAQAPRAEIDLNRDEREIDPSLVAPPPSAAGLVQTARTRGGLGLIPSRIGGAGAIWLSRIPAAELQRRIETIHRPYHAALGEMLARTRDRFGTAILLDCHSMPPRTLGALKEAQVVFGDRHGASIGEDFTLAAAAAADAHGFSSERNQPYAGGHITDRHGRPASGIHALQIEIDRSAYLADDLRSPGPGFDRTARMIAGVAAALAARALDTPHAIAAE